MITMEANCLIEIQDFLSQFSVVLWDLDDTLYSEIDYVRSGFLEIARCCPEIPRMAEKLWDAFKNGQKAIDAVLRAEGKYSADMVGKCLHIYRNQKPNIQVYPEAKGILEYLTQMGIHMGMITDGRPEGQRAKIQALGIEHYFEKIIITDELGSISFRKPYTGAYEQMQAFFRVPYEQMVYVGDNPRKDFIAPAQLGMHSVYFNNPLGLYSGKGV